MTPATAANPIRQDAPYLIAAFAATFIIFFIDDAKYNLAWTTDWANWLFFIFYYGFVVLGQYLLYQYTLKKVGSTTRGVLTIALGLPLGFALAVAGLLSIRTLFIFIGAHAG